MVAGDTYHVTNSGHIVMGDAGSGTAPNNNMVTIKRFIAAANNKIFYET